MMLLILDNECLMLLMLDNGNAFRFRAVYLVIMGLWQVYNLYFQFNYHAFGLSYFLYSFVVSLTN